MFNDKRGFQIVALILILAILLFVGLGALVMFSPDEMEEVPASEEGVFEKSEIPLEEMTSEEVKAALKEMTIEEIKAEMDKLGEILETPPPTIPATSDEPIVVSDEFVDISNDAAIILVNVYNYDTAQELTLTVDSSSCKESVDFHSDPQVVPEKTYKEFELLLSTSQLSESCAVNIEVRNSDGIYDMKQISLVTH
ncbi:hypothetical protein HN419_04960 [Candidatus Woesearchaeota archaeon]|jgi:hypothetical protein|nr:hypothetical protein [Candidatus Woesearchaeota archaeon]MBT3537773.1 hypothetical protein [Candidatus Woesearchaeota archaeon]MBT4697904.1 hypothetical protein [Candidatus Woesearchaeota archaeon]MBT4717267.1 hypothetical protein [Candidatus Woesearchaeota archaeon]MBT7105442.1 hypothetical protein [Candidatus Woesearchaeota archaeon]